jgi:endonuclease/exonuclease/phosphatase family protein
MKLTTWNCRRGPLNEKIAALDDLRSDILVLTEASPPRTATPDILWFGERRYGVAIVARPPYRVQRLRHSAVPCVYPVRVSGPQTFTLFGIWTWQAPTYKQALINGLDAYVRLPKPWVIAGDFNGNIGFDRPRARTKWSDCFARLEAQGLVSAFHAHTGTNHGAELVPTHYFLTHRDRPFHIDYCFIPEAWLPQLQDVTIAPYEKYASLSDHRPVSFALRTS